MEPSTGWQGGCAPCTVTGLAHTQALMGILIWQHLFVWPGLLPSDMSPVTPAGIFPRIPLYFMSLGPIFEEENLIQQLLGNDDQKRYHGMVSVL